MCSVCEAPPGGPQETQFEYKPKTATSSHNQKQNMKTTSLHLIHGLFATAALGFLTSAGHAQFAPGAAARPLHVQRLYQAAGGLVQRHARNPETAVQRTGSGQFGWDKVTILPDIPGALDLIVIDSNNRGQVIGIYFDGDFNPHGFIYAHGNYTGLDFEPTRINDRGQIVGNAFDSDYIAHSYVYDKGIYTGVEFPGALKGGGLVTGINDRGQILGFYSDGHDDHGFIYDQGVYTALPDFPGARLTYPQSINNRGQIVGYAYDQNFQNHSFTYEKGVYTSFAASSATGSYPRDVNEQGQIVGYVYDSAFTPHSFVNEKGVFTGIEIPGALVTYAFGINDRKQIIGTYYDADFLPHGYVLSR